ncbi:MAG: glycosyltransferase family 2 protein [Chloroflexi bacterium]|nr:glycosyltransferase family 2 protein [Chloroflexota bacterium]PKB57250.1 MAG: glycosyl transferase [SAR202 cluster bacterium Casp-Chloro-G3]
MPSSVDIIIPVYNEERDLPKSIKKLTEFLEANLANPWQVIIADNASTDGTRAVSEGLCTQYPHVNYRYLSQKGRGRALRATWLESDADLLSYMDVDLSTDLAYFPPMIKALESDCHLAIGSRLSRDSIVARSFKREFISRAYNLMIRAMFFTTFPDAQCGFKALTRQAAQAIVPQIKNNNWFFDTELLIIAAKNGYRIKSVPVKWDDDPNSSVNVISTVTEDLKGLLRLRFGGVPRVLRPEISLSETG